MITLPLNPRPTSLSTPTIWSLGSLRISHGNQGRCTAPRCGAELLIPTSVPLTLHHTNLQRILRPCLDLLYLPSEAQGLQTSPLHGWRVELDPERLTQLASELGDHRFSPTRYRRRLASPLPLQPRVSPQPELLEALLQLLQLSSCKPLVLERQLERVGLDRSIQRLIALLLCGDLIEISRQQHGEHRGSKAHIFDQLIDWIEANLHRPLLLSELADQSGYSQRSLRNFFQERFGCGPVQWIRSRRLSGARQRLLSPEATDTVSLIAGNFGYPHLSQFSRDFQRAYNIRPSDLLREGLRSLGAD
jgi:AraC-like DNA-binding protein